MVAETVLRVSGTSILYSHVRSINPDDKPET